MSLPGSSVWTRRKGEKTYGWEQRGGGPLVVLLTNLVQALGCQPTSGRNEVLSFCCNGRHKHREELVMEPAKKLGGSAKKRIGKGDKLRCGCLTLNTPATLTSTNDTGGYPFKLLLPHAVVDALPTHQKTEIVTNFMTNRASLPMQQWNGYQRTHLIICHHLGAAH
eukprot:1920551-Amphidinium_carterae.1